MNNNQTLFCVYRPRKYKLIDRNFVGLIYIDINNELTICEIVSLYLACNVFHKKKLKRKHKKEN